MSSRAKRRERNQSKEQPPQPKNQEKKEKSLWRWLELISPTGKIAAAVALFLTVVGSYYAFSPKISVTSSGLIDPLNPYSTPFAVKNESLLSVKSIKTKWKVRELTSEGGAAIIGPTFSTTSPAIPFLDPGESTSTFFPEVFKFSGKAGALKHIDVDVVVSYRPTLLPYVSSKQFRFSTIKTSDGTFHWVSKSISE